MKTRRGFTVIELLVVTSIIALLATLVLASLNNAKSRARDTKRITHVDAIRKSLEFYIDKVRHYPVNTDSDCDGWDTGNLSDTNFIQKLVDEGFFNQTPVDPAVGGSCDGFAYKYFTASTNDPNGCPFNRGNYYVLGIVDLERSGNPSPSSPGFECSGHNWQDDFEWVTGQFER